jgi:hypothetical protein
VRLIGAEVQFGHSSLADCIYYSVVEGGYVTALIATACLAQSPSEAAKTAGDQLTGSYPAMLLLTDTKKAYDG